MNDGKERAMEQMNGTNEVTRQAPRLVDNRWVAGPDELAVFFGVDALSGLFVKLLRVPAATRAYILQGDNATEVPQGEYEIEGFFTRLNHLLRDQHAEILVTRTGALPVPIALDGLRSSEHLEVSARLTVAVRIENVPAFARHFMTMPGTITTAELAELLSPPVRQLLAEFLAARSLRELAQDPDTRSRLNQHLAGGLAVLLAEYGLAATRVDTLELRHDRYDEQRARVAGAVLAAEDRRAELAGVQALDALYTDTEWQRIAREEGEARLRYRRAELRQDERLEQAELTLKNAERAHAIRAREIELYGRIVESRSRKEALARGAQDAVAALEHELAAKGGAREDEETRWAHLRELAAIRMRTELEVAQQDAAEMMTVARQRFGHQLLQQQIRNKIEQARGIEDAARQRAELARLHEQERAAAARARALEDEEHAGRLQLLQVANLAHRREAERVIEWEDAQAAARRHAAGRDAAALDAQAQHEKLLRTIAADTLHAREAQQVQLEGEQARAAIAAAEREAARRHELALGGLDDTAKLMLAPAANAPLLADLLKTRVQADMSPDQLHGLAAVASAPNVAQDVATSAALELARGEVERERARHDAQLERERRHQLDLLAMQNDVNKAALASQAQVAAAVAAARPPAAGPATPAACDHGLAQQGDRYCGACGAPLPARR
jgi:hypothetical protein